MYALYMEYFDDNHSYLAAIFDEKPDKEKLKEFISEEYFNFSDEQIEELLAGERIIDSEDYSAYHYCFYLWKINTWEWL